MMRVFLVAAVLLARPAEAGGGLAKVVKLLQKMQVTLEAEAHVEAKEVADYLRWARDEELNSQNAIANDKAKIESLSAIVEEAEGAASNADAEVRTLSAQTASNAKALDEAKATRASEHAAFLKEEGELSDAIDQVVRATAVLKRAGLGLVQFKSTVNEVVAGLSAVLGASSVTLGDVSRLRALLQSAQQADDDDLDFPQPKKEAYTSHAGDIIAVLSDLKVKAESQRNALLNAETQKKHEFEMLKQSLEDEMKVADRDVAAKQQLAAESRQEGGEASQEREATQASLAEMEEYLASLMNQVEDKKGAWEARQKARADETDAVRKAIAVLTDETVAAASRVSLAQTHARSAGVREEVASVLQDAAERLKSIGLAQLAIRTRSGGDAFGKVRQLIKNMISRLQASANAEADEKAFCDKETSKTDDKKSSLSEKVGTLKTRIDKGNAGVAQLKEEAADLSDELAKLDAGLSVATSLRQKETTEFAQVDKDTQDTISGVTKAIEILRGTYGAALLQKKPSYGGPVFQATKYDKKSDEAGGVVAMLEVILEDAERTRVEAVAAERESAAAFEKLQRDSAMARAKMEAELSGKQSERAQLERALADNGSDLKERGTELDAVLEYSSKLRERCTHKAESFETRSAKREQEIESLQQALEILNSAGTSLLQLGRRRA